MQKSEIHLGPWMRGQWNGQFVSVDGTSTADFTYDDVSDVIICCEEEYGGYDGTSFGIVKLTDGRYISWETTWGPTGNGLLYFCAEEVPMTTSEQFSDLLSDTEVMKLRTDGIVSAKESGFKGFQRLITLVRQDESSETLTLSALREELGTRNTRRRPMTVGKR